MNIEDKYSTHFKTHKSELAPELWEKISTKLDRKAKTISFNWIAVAACLLIGISIYTYESVKIESKVIAQSIELPKYSAPILTTPIVTLDKPIDLNPKATILSKRLAETLIPLKEIGLIEIYNPIKKERIKYTKTTFVKLKIKGQPRLLVRKRKFENPVEKIIDFAKLILKKESQNIEFPTIEIDYQSLLTLNDNS